MGEGYGADIRSGDISYCGDAAIMKSRLNVFMTTSKKNLYLAYPAIASLFVHNQDSEIFLYLASEDLVEQDMTAETELAERYGHHVILRRVNEEACRKQIISSDPEHWPVGAMACYWMFHELLPAEVERVLAIEADTVTTGSLKEFYETDLESNYAACPDPDHKPLNHQYVMDRLNGDVFTFVGSIYDVRRIRKDFTLQQILAMDHEISRIYRQSQMELTFGVLFRGKIKYIPAVTYSIEENRHFAERFGYDYMQKCEESCRLLHFSSTGDKEKPWNPTNMMPGYLQWWDYARTSSYSRQYFEEQWKIHAGLKAKNEAIKKNITYRNVLLMTLCLTVLLEMAVIGMYFRTWYAIPISLGCALAAFAVTVVCRAVTVRRKR